MRKAGDVEDAVPYAYQADDIRPCNNLTGVIRFYLRAHTVRPYKFYGYPRTAKGGSYVLKTKH